MKRIVVLAVDSTACFDMLHQLGGDMSGIASRLGNPLLAGQMPDIFETMGLLSYGITVEAVREATEGAADRLIWRPIEDGDRIVETIQAFGSVTLRNSHPAWVRDADGRVYEAVWTVDDKDRGYWWDTEGESPADPVHICPHPMTDAARLRSNGQPAAGAVEGEKP